MPKPVVNESTSTEAKGGGPSASKKALSKSTKSSKQPPKKATSTKAKAKAKANNKSASAKRKKPGRNTLMTKAVVDEKIHRGRNQRLGATRRGAGVQGASPKKNTVIKKKQSQPTLIKMKYERIPRDSIPPQFDEANITLPKDAEGPGLKKLNKKAIIKLKATHKNKSKGVVKGLCLKDWPLGGRTVIKEECEYYFNIKMLYAFIYNTHYLFYYCCWLICLGIWGFFTYAFESATGRFHLRV